MTFLEKTLSIVSSISLLVCVVIFTVHNRPYMYFSFPIDAHYVC